ncbi:hypothetical protein GGR58DRAFT_484415 [Xylaria digitata]|nr:hypothetical protein GGR58DRAFT_484415 [Xylaria digitata]
MTRLSAHDPTRAVKPPSLIGTDHGKTRSACNRCHQQKLRCVKTKEHGSCERCMKLKIECRYNPRERRVVRSKSFRTGPSAPLELRDLAPATAPAVLDTQQSVTLVPSRIECDWFSFLTGRSDNAEGRDDLNLEPRFPIQIDPTTAPVVGLDQSAQITGAQSTHTLDCHQGVALHLIPSHQDVPSEVENNHSFDFLHSPGPSSYPNTSGYQLGPPLTSETGRLTSLNMALYECASKLPSIKASRAEPVGSMNGPYTTDSSAREAMLLSLDDLFCATNEFINVMKSLCPTTGCHEIPPTAASASMTRISYHSAQGTNTAASHCIEPHGLTYRQALEPPPRLTTIEGSCEPGIPSSVIQSSPHLDEATLLLFLSCHCRLIEIYESLFQVIQKCIKGSYTTSHSPAGIILPQLQVGGFGGVSCPGLRVDFSGPRLPPATVSMHLVLTTTLSSQLWTQIRESMRRRRDFSGPRNRVSAGHLEVADPAWDIAVERTDRVSQTIEAIRNLL